MWQRINQWLIWIVSFIFCTNAVAKQEQGVGEIAQSILEPVMNITGLIKVVCLITGVAMVFGSLVKYKQHRNNPVEAPLSSAFIMLLAGIALLVLAFLPYEYLTR